MKENRRMPVYHAAEITRLRAQNTDMLKALDRIANRTNEGLAARDIARRAIAAKANNKKRDQPASPDKVLANFEVMLGDPHTTYFSLGKFASYHRVRILEALRELQCL